MKLTQQSSAVGGTARMADIQSLFGMTPRAIRYYEIVGLIEATRTRTNARVFDAKARERLRWIARLRAAGVSLEGIREVVELDADAEGRALQAAVALTKLAENCPTGCGLNWTRWRAPRASWSRNWWPTAARDRWRSRPDPRPASGQCCAGSHEAEPA